MTQEQWSDLEDSEKAFQSEWITQCEIAEASAMEDMPAWTHATLADKAGFSLWIGVYAAADVPKEWTIHLTHARTMVCKTDCTGLDVVACVSCAEVRRILRKPRKVKR